MIRRLRLPWPVLVLVGAAVVAAALVATRERPAANVAEERVWPVETANVDFADVRPMLRFYGEIVARREVELRALVPGTVMQVADSFASGGRVGAGTALVMLDPFDHEQAVVERAAALDEAQARLAETRARLAGERGVLAEDERQAAIYERDLARRESLAGSAVSEKGLDDARLAFSQARSRFLLRRQAAEALSAQVAQQEAAISRLEAALARARRALDDTVLRAPFDGYLADTAAEAGKRVGPADRLARLIAADGLEAKFHMPDPAFGRTIGGPAASPATVLWRLGPKVMVFDAVIDRVDSEIDPGTGGIVAYASVTDDGGAAFEALRQGAFVEVLVPDRLYRGVARLPDTALHGAGTVYAVVDGRLQARAVEVVGRDGDALLVAGGLSAGEQVTVTRLTEIGEGLKVVVR